MSLEARHRSDCARGAVTVEAGAGLVAEAGGLDCASAGIIITEASNPPIKSFERIENLQVGGYETLTNAPQPCSFLELHSARDFSFSSFEMQKFRVFAGNNHRETDSASLVE